MPSGRGSAVDAAASDVAEAVDGTGSDLGDSSDSGDSGDPGGSRGPSDPRSRSDPGARSDPIEWGPVRYERLRSVAVGVGLVVLLAIGAVIAIVAAGVVGTAWTVIAGGATIGRLSLGNAWVFVVLLLVGGPVSVIYVLIGYDRSPEGMRRLLDAGVGNYSPSRESLRAEWVLAGAASIGALWLWEPERLAAGLGLLFPLIWVVPMVAGSRGTSVRLDPGERVVERTDHTHDRTRTDDLDAVVRTRRIDLPWTTVFLLAYRGNMWYRSTPWLFVPTDRADDVEAALEDALARSDGPDRASVPERVVLALLGTGSLVVGLTMAVAGEGGAGAALALLTAPFSLLFLALAARL